MRTRSTKQRGTPTSIWASHEELRLLDEAAAQVGLTRSAFLRSVATAAARAIIAPPVPRAPAMVGGAQ